MFGVCVGAACRLPSWSSLIGSVTTRRFLRRRQNGSYVSPKKYKLLEGIPESRWRPTKQPSIHLIQQQVEKEELERRATKWYVPNVKVGDLIKLKQSIGDVDSKAPEEEVEMTGLVICKRNRGVNSSSWSVELLMVMKLNNSSPSIHHGSGMFKF
jgi:hypothetical protein